jgi:hypothetical protein
VLTPDKKAPENIVENELLDTLEQRIKKTLKKKE